MTRRRWSLVALALCVTIDFGVTVDLVQAQSAAPAPSPTDPAKPVAPPAPAPADLKAADKPATAATPVKPAAATDAVVLDATSLESIMGRSVKSPTGEDMGRIVDMLVTSSGEVRAAIIDFGGFLGVGSRKIAVDWKALIFSDIAKSGNVLVALTRNQVRMAPEYKQGDPIVVLEATTPEQAKAGANPASAKPDSPKPDAAKPSDQADGAKPDAAAPASEPAKAAPSETPTTDDTPKK